MHGDIGDRALVARLLAEHQPDAIVNFAAESHVDRSIDGPAAFVQTNVVGTLALLEAARDYWRALDGAQRRTRSASCTSPPTRSTARWATAASSPKRRRIAPNSPYSASKAASDHLVRAFHHTYGLPVLTTNCSNNYGPYQFPEKLIPLMIAKALAGEPLPVYGDGRNVRDWLYVGDHCARDPRACSSAAASARPTTSAATPSARTSTWCTRSARCSTRARPLADGTRARVADHLRQDRPGHDRRYAIDASKLQARTRLEAARRRSSRASHGPCDWYLDNQAWVQRVLDGSYRLERIGAAA